MPRLLQRSKAIQEAALKASSFRAAGVGDHIMRVQRSWEPEKPCWVLRLVTGGRWSRENQRPLSCVAGWRIGA